MRKNRIFTAGVFSITALAILASCSKDSGGGGGSAPVGIPVVKTTTADNYLSGRKFCETYYEDFTRKEHGIWVKVPRDYENPQNGSLEIYAYTIQPFNSSKPSYIFIDGGPGQNTHGLMPEYLNGEMNEIRFDQRGLGCSAPETFDIYRDQKLYSSRNTIRDMEEVRKAYKIEKWSVYGVSYGTVPATMYGSAYPQATKSVVLEGVVGKGELLHLWSYKVEKLNLFLKRLTSAQKSSFSDLLFESSPESQAFMGFLFSTFYQDAGLRDLAGVMDLVISKEGKIQRDVLKKLRESSEKKEAKYPLPQQPGAVDERFLNIIYCKELGHRYNDRSTINYSREIGFIVTDNPKRTNAGECDEVGVQPQDEKPYDLTKNPVSVPVYYFQGSHDGATIAKGAIEHWKTVPKGSSYFLLAQKGGHNPNLTRLESSDTPFPEYLKAAERNLFKKSVTASPITADDITSVNRYSKADQEWRMYLEPTLSTTIDPELEGIKVIGF